MKGFKLIEDFSITDCCCFFKIKPSDLPEIIGSIQENPEHKEIKKHLLQLIKKDNHDFALCSSIEEYKKYLNSWRDGLHRDEATKKIAELKSEAEEFAFYTKSMNSISDCKTYIKKYPYGRYINKVSAKLDDMSFKSCTFKSEYEEYLVKFPHGRYINKVSAKLDDMSFKSCIFKSEYEEYLVKFPHGRHVIEAKEKVNKIDKTKRIGLIVLIIFIALCILWL